MKTKIASFLVCFVLLLSGCAPTYYSGNNTGNNTGENSANPAKALVDLEKAEINSSEKLNIIIR